MAASINKVILISHVGKDPETRALQDSAQVVSFSLASSESWNDRSSGERREKTEWHRIVVMGNDHLTKIAASRVHKGSKVYLEGKLQTRKWQARDGTDHNTTEILLGRFNASLFLMDGCADQGGHYHTVSRPHTSARDVRGAVHRGASRPLTTIRYPPVRNLTLVCHIIV